MNDVLELNYKEILKYFKNKDDNMYKSKQTSPIRQSNKENITIILEDTNIIDKTRQKISCIKFCLKMVEC